MGAMAVMSISSAVVALVQLTKRIGVTSRYAPFVVFGFSLIGELMWAISQPAGSFNRTQVFDYFAAWIQISGFAIGAYEMAKSVPLVAALAGPGYPKPDAGDVEVKVYPKGEEPQEPSRGGP